MWQEELRPPQGASTASGGLEPPRKRPIGVAGPGRTGRAVVMALGPRTEMPRMREAGHLGWSSMEVTGAMAGGNSPERRQA
jgi:hypothetical protein